MAIQASEILFKYSVTTGTAGNTSAGTAAGSLGKYISTTQIADASLDNLFNDISGDQNAAGQVDYRCFFIHNSNGSLTYQNVVCWIDSQVSGGADVAIAVDTTAPSAIGSSTAQALTVASSTTAPAGLTFSTTAINKATGLSIGNVPAGSCAAVWLRRTANNSAALSNDGATIGLSGDTAA